MPQSGIGYIDQNARSNWIRLHTLVMVRWFAIMGQTCAIVLAHVVYGLQLALIPCAIAIGMSVMANLVAYISFPDNRRLNEAETVYTLLFDTFQLCLLLAFVGGLNNPFALLVLAPLTIAATVLPTRSTVYLAITAVLMITIVGLAHIPIRTAGGVILRMPNIFVFGFWTAIITGIIFISVYTRRVTAEMTSMSEALLATQMALAREQKLTDLGGVVAATAHELGTPLATIKLVSAELMEELGDHEELHADAVLIREQADRCRDILQSMGRAGKDDLHLRSAPWAAVIREAAEPHIHRGKDVVFEFDGVLESDPTHPDVLRKPEVVHGLRNLIQNAVDFAQATVFVDISWSDTKLSVSITDDGRGFTPQALSRIGDPFVRRRRKPGTPSDRPGYQGMGLGLFIAKTLIERTGGSVSFDHDQPKGAKIIMIWPRTNLEMK
ncbi:MAG: sensor histidine kinase RegB, partial [Planktomarina sp.]